MRLLEFQSKDLLRRYGIPCPDGRVCTSPAEAARAAEELGPAAVKAQVPAGRRGLAGGVRLAATPGEAEAAARDLLGGELLGRVVERVLVEQAVEIVEEIFVSWTYDSRSRTPVVLASRQGGVDVEAQVAEGGAVSVPVDPRRRFEPYQGRELGVDLGVAPGVLAGFGDLVARLGRVFAEQDAFMVEVNPLAVTADGRLCAVGAAVELDDDSAHRHPDWPEDLLAPRLSEHERAVVAADADDRGTSGVRYQELDGDVIYLVIGGGSGLTYMDYLDRVHGLRPANLIDVSPGRGLAKLQVAIRGALSRPGGRGVLFTLPHSNLARVADVFEQFALAFEQVRDTWEPVPIVLRMSGQGDDVARARAAEIPNCTFFGDEVSIEEAIDHFASLLEPAGAPS